MTESDREFVELYLDELGSVIGGLDAEPIAEAIRWLQRIRRAQRHRPATAS